MKELCYVTLYAIIDDFLKLENHQEDVRQKLSDSEIIFIFLTACYDFGGNYSKAQDRLFQGRFILTTLSRSQFNRRIHRLQDLIMALHQMIAEIQKRCQNFYAIDSCPIPICQNIRIKRSKIVSGEEYRGYCASKKQYYYGLKLHLIVGMRGEIIEFDFTPASCHDVKALDILPFHLPEGSEIFADKAYNHYLIEEMMLEGDQIKLAPQRKVNSKRSDNLDKINRYRQNKRKIIETIFSDLAKILPRNIHAVTSKGFILKLIGFIVSFNLVKFAA